MRGPIAAGKSSFDLIDPERLWGHLEIRPGGVLLDAACGVGAYAFAMAERLGPGVRILGADLWAEGIEAFNAEAARRSLGNVRGEVSDLRELPLGDGSVDVCLLATVLHDLAVEGKEGEALHEVARVLRPGGTLVVIEFEKVDGPPGPPASIRLTSEETENLIIPHGFAREARESIGSFNYLLRFRRMGGTAPRKRE